MAGLNSPALACVAVCPNMMATSWGPRCTSFHDPSASFTCNILNAVYLVQQVQCCFAGVPLLFKLTGLYMSSCCLTILNVAEHMLNLLACGVMHASSSSEPVTIHLLAVRCKSMSLGCALYGLCNACCARYLPA